MKRNRSKGLVLFLMLVLIMSASILPSAAAKPEKLPKIKPMVTEQPKPQKVIRDTDWEIRKDAAETLKNQLELEKETLEAEYEALLEAGDTDNALIKAEALAAAKARFVQAKAELKSVIRNGYTTEELSALEAAGEALEAADASIEVLPVENIMVKGKHLGFDTPPVIKTGRTLVPVKALVQAFGAQVAWDPALQKVTITKDDLTMVLTLGDTEVFVNGDSVQLDVPAQAMNGRTVVPLRFIAEKMNFVVTYEDGDITVEDAEEAEEADAEDVEEQEEAEANDEASVNEEA
ncbi:copper amine oxidase N-terminal domain-containing protein [Acidaminobacter hydrogenoformans]|uniref:Copper amine oxidase N-terminal domain-containing protein n=1 Tax=Acidaminobacter hydrogenoformans DSM 2784 TaxID=1120920 RepID=A0A1G5RVP3_9FIRM|nr:copper amine oxidase N-terminal domain-containing protein [Acidaminobacter hydrogenoformans]SCZ77389.1 Copper amine oxidase N-terminal domain-containing protein [Acidaminobacter hydrogenoformans DSM 2784]